MIKKGLLNLLTTLLFLIAVHSVQATTVMFTGHLTQFDTYGGTETISRHFAVGDTFTGSFTYDNTATTGRQISGADKFVYTEVLSELSLTFTSGNSMGFTFTGRSGANNQMSVTNNIENNLRNEDIVSLVYSLSQSDTLDGLANRDIVFRLYDFDANAIDNSRLADLDFSSFFSNLDKQSNEISFLSTPDNLYQEAEFELDTLTIRPSSVPVPGAAWLLGSGIICLAGLGRKLPAGKAGQDA